MQKETLQTDISLICSVLNILRSLKNPLGGDGEIRTLVQTGKSSAFYMFIFAWIVGVKQDRSHQPNPYPLNFTRSPRLTPSYSRYSCTTDSDRFGIRASGWCDVPAPSAGIKPWPTVLRL